MTPNLDVSWKYVAALVGIDTLVVSLALSDLVPESVWQGVSDASAALIEPRTARVLAVLSITLAMLAVGRVRIRNLHADWRRLPFGTVLAAVSWLVVQLGVAAWSHSGVVWPSSRDVVFYVLAAFDEELLFRGVLLLWLVGRIRRYGWNERAVLAASVTVSSLVFALAHLPMQYSRGSMLPDALVALAGHVEMGLLFGALMLLTRNLWVTTFVHAIVNMRPGYQGATTMTPWFDPYAIVPVVVAAIWLAVPPEHRRTVDRYSDPSE